MGNRYWTLMAVFCMCVFVHVQADILSDLQHLKERKLCGKTLADTLQTLCAGDYNSMYKKSENDPDYMYQSDQEDQTGLIEIQPQFPFRSRINAAAMYPQTFRRYTRGIIAECCYKPCSRSELKTYCGGKK